LCYSCIFRAQVKTFQAQGNGTVVEMTALEVDGRPLTPGELGLPLWFGEVAAGSTYSRTIAVRNDGGVPLPFVWQQTEKRLMDRQVGPLYLMSILNECSRFVKLNYLSMVTLCLAALEYFLSYMRMKQYSMHFRFQF
jgi:hypothetical protein